VYNAAALIQEELTKAYDHGVRKYWILNVGDLKPAEIDIDYFMQLATDEPRMAKMSSTTSSPNGPQSSFHYKFHHHLGDQTTRAEQMAIEPKNRDKSTMTLPLATRLASQLIWPTS